MNTEITPILALFALAPLLFSVKIQSNAYLIEQSPNHRLLPQMKVHPVPGNRNISLRYDVAQALARANSCRQKKLRRLPHIFAKVLELPFHSDADVSIHETPESLIFTAATNGITGDVRADPIEIYTGVTKIVLRGNGIFDSSGTEFELDLWRFRLPACTRPELASAAYYDGELVVTVPKGAEGGDEEEEGGVGAGSLVLVL